MWLWVLYLNSLSLTISSVKWGCDSTHFLKFLWWLPGLMRAKRSEESPVPTRLAVNDKLLVERPFPTWCLVWDWGLYSPLPLCSWLVHLIHSAKVEWLIRLMNLEAESGQSLFSPLFMISWESEFDFTNLALSVVLSYAVSLVIKAYNGQYIGWSVHPVLWVRRQPCSLRQFSH